MNAIKQPLAELIGTFTLVFLGAGAGAMAATSGGGIVGVALTHGLALVVIVYAWGPISGAHVNPAVTFGLALTGKVDWATAIKYWIAQFVGGALAAYLLAYLIGTESGLGKTVGTLTSTDAAKAIILEAVLTFFLMIAVFGSAVAGRNGNAFGLAIGWVLTADIIFGGALTGASMNPARSFGPFLVLKDFQYMHIYLIGPLVGAGVAAVIYDALYIEKKNK